MCPICFVQVAGVLRFSEAASCVNPEDHVFVSRSQGISLSGVTCCCYRTLQDARKERRVLRGRVQVAERSGKEDDVNRTCEQLFSKRVAVYSPWFHGTVRGVLEVVFSKCRIFSFK